MHKYSIGQLVYFEGPFQYDAARGQYKIVKVVPIEKDNNLLNQERDGSVRARGRGIPAEHRARVIFSLPFPQCGPEVKSNSFARSCCSPK